MTILSVTSTEERQPGTWREAFLAGLPHLLMALLMGMGKFISFYELENTKTISIIIGYSLGLLAIIILIWAWRRGWPLWSASWYLYGVWVTMAVFSLIIDHLELEDSWRYTNALFLIMIGGFILGYFGLLLKSKMHALLAVAFLFPLLGLMFVEFVPNNIEGWLAIGLGLLGAGTAGSIVRLGKFRFALGLVLGLNLAAGLSIAYISEYKMLDLPPLVPAHVPRFDQFLTNLALYSIFGLGVVAIPFILRGLWNFGRRKFTS